MYWNCNYPNASTKKLDLIHCLLCFFLILYIMYSLFNIKTLHLYRQIPVNFPNWNDQIFAQTQSFSFISVASCLPKRCKLPSRSLKRELGLSSILPMRNSWSWTEKTTLVSWWCLAGDVHLGRGMKAVFHSSVSYSQGFWISGQPCWIDNHWSLQLKS